MHTSLPIRTPEDYEAVYGRIVPRKSKPLITIICEMCGTAVQSQRPKKFCSDKCRHDSHVSLTDPRLSQLATAAAIAAALGVSRTTVHNLVRAGKLRAHRIGRNILIVRPSGMRLASNEKMPQEVAEKLRAFTERSCLSVRRFALLCGLSVTNTHRILTGSMLAAAWPKYRSAVTDGLAGCDLTYEQIREILKDH